MTFGDCHITVHEKGCPDWLMVRYQPITGHITGKKYQNVRVDLIWLETKQPKSRERCICATKTSRQSCTHCDQQNWRVREQARGAVVLRIESLEQLMALEVWK